MDKKNYIAGLKYFLSENLRDFNQRYLREQRNFSQSYADNSAEFAEKKNSMQLATSTQQQAILK